MSACELGGFPSPHPPRAFSHFLSSPFISLKPVIFCPFFPHSLLSLSSSSFWSLMVSAVALEGRGRCLHGAGVCSTPLLLYTQCSAQCPSAYGDSHLWPSWSLLFPQAQRHISDLYEDLRDGHNLISLLEVLSGDSLVCVSLPACLPWGLFLLPTQCLACSLTFSSLLQPQRLPLARVLALQPKARPVNGHGPPAVLCLWALTQ